MTVRRAPGPKGHWLFGSLADRRDRPLDFYTENRDTYGDVVRWRIGPLLIHQLNHPDHAKHVLVDHADRFTKGRQIPKLRPLLGKGLLTNEGASWKKQRRLMQPAFHRERLVRLAEGMIADTRRLLDRWTPLAERGEVVDVAAEMSALTMEIVGRALFGANLASDSSVIFDALTASLEEANVRLLQIVEVPLSIPTPGNRRFLKARARLDAIVYRVIAERRAGKTEGTDLLKMLVEARDDEDSGSSMDDTQLRDEVMTLFLAGHETTANALAWTFHLLAAHPEIDAKMRAEIATVLGERSPSPEDVPKLAYTTRVFEESMRLYPPAWLIARATRFDEEFGGYTIPKGTMVGVAPYAIHRHPKFWPDPTRFDPDRFLPERAEGRPRYAYLPFGGGQRLCIGIHFAMMEAVIILAMVAQRVRLASVPGHPVVPLAQVTLRPKYGIKMTLSPAANGSL